MKAFVDAPTCDANGNRLTRTVNSVTEDYVYDDADKLLEVKIGQQTVKEFTYDSAGRTTAVETSAGTTSLTYDYESRVTGITYPNQSTNAFTYNGLDTRVGMSDSGGSKSFLRDGVSVTSPVLSDGSATYTPAISERRSSTTTFYHAGIKNGDSQTNTSESVTASTQYDAFGNVTSSSGTWSGPFAYGGPYGYQSDPDSGLKLLGHRYYDPSTGRFLTRDPVKDGRNWYGYCGNNPITWSDPDGRARLWKWLKEVWAGLRENSREIIGRIGAGIHGEEIPDLPIDSIKPPPGISRELPPSHGLDKRIILPDDDAPGGAGLLIGGGFWKRIKELVESIDPTPVGIGRDVGDAISTVVDPWVREKIDKSRRIAEWWMSPDSENPPR